MVANYTRLFFVHENSAYPRCVKRQHPPYKADAVCFGRARDQRSLNDLKD